MPTITDTFTRANSTSTLGSTESPVLAWTADAGTWGISSNQGYVVTASGFDSRATIPVGVANQDVSAVVTSTSDVAVIASYVDGSNYYKVNVAGATVDVKRVQGGSETSLSGAVGSWSSGSVLRLVTNDSGSGTQVTAYIGATQVYTGLDTTVGRPAGTRAGLRDGTGGSPGTPRFDNFSVTYTVAVDTMPATHVHVEVAFTTDPDDPSPSWTDQTSRLDTAAGVEITRGRQDEYGAVQPGRCSLVFDNTDGALTPGRAASTYYPNVKPSRRIRVTYRNPTVAGNLLTANQASIETSSNDWTTTSGFGYIGGATKIRSSTHALAGTWSLHVTWPTTGAGNTAIEYTQVDGLIIGRTYILSLSVWVPTGSPGVRAAVLLGATSATSTVFDAWQRLSVTFTATATTHYVGVDVTSATSGNDVWVDSVMLDEGTTLNTFTTTAAPIEYRFDGYVEEWVTEWPGGNKYTQARVTAVDLLARLGTKRLLRSVVEETLLLDDPAVYYPLGEPEGSTTAGDVSGVNLNTLSILPVGAAGGTLTFGTGTGPGTDGIPAPMFAPASATSGFALVADIPIMGGASDVTLRASSLSSTLRNMTIARLVNATGTDYLDLRFDVNGHAVALGYSNWSGANVFSINSGTVQADGTTRNLAITLTQSGGTITAKLFDGSTQLGTTSYSNTSLPVYTRLFVGGGPKDQLFTGTISHIAAYTTGLSSTSLGEQALSTTTGFAGERSDQRIARYASWIGLPTARQVLDTGQSNVAWVDTTGKKPLDAMQQIADTEQGVLFADTQGRLVFLSRLRLYSVQPVIATIDAHDTSRDTTPETNKQDLVNDMVGKRPDGPEIRVNNPASMLEHGIYDDSLEVIVATDAEVLGALQWKISQRAQPVARVPGLDIDAMTNTDIQTQVRDLDIGSRLQVTGQPTQAPASTLDLFVQGYSESFSTQAWRINTNVTAAGVIQGWQVDNATYSQVDAGYRFVY